MTTVLWIIVVLICLAVGIWLGRYTAPGVERSREMEQERDEAQAELQRYREDVRTHFEKTAHLFNAVTGTYRELYEHLADGSERLGTGENARLLESKPEDRTLQTPEEDEGGTAAGEPAPDTEERGAGQGEPAPGPQAEPAGQDEPAGEPGTEQPAEADEPKAATHDEREQPETPETPAGPEEPVREPQRNHVEAYDEETAETDRQEDKRRA